MESLVHHVHADYLPPFVLHDARYVTEEQLAASVTAYVQHLNNAQAMKLTAEI